MRYSTGAIVLHWLIAILIGFNYAAAWVAEDMPKDQAMQVMGNHKAIGLTVLVLSVLRILWRITHRPPPLSSTLKTWEAGLSRAVHSLFYVLIVAVPLMGWALHSAFSGGKPVGVFGLFSYPGLPLAQDKQQGEVFAQIHGTLATVMLALIVLHVAGALKHALIDRDGEMRRMWFGRGQKVVAE